LTDLDIVGRSKTELAELMFPILEIGPGQRVGYLDPRSILFVDDTNEGHDQFRLIDCDALALLSVGEIAANRNRRTLKLCDVLSLRYCTSAPGHKFEFMHNGRRLGGQISSVAMLKFRDQLAEVVD